MTNEQLKAERIALGESLALELERLARLCRETGAGVKVACEELCGQIDGYWHAFVVGAGDAQRLCSNDYWEDEYAEGR